ncbi:unnamed protein product, partial [Medioppia subpectinata]
MIRYPGAPIQVLKVSAEGRFELNLEALSAILLRDSIRDKPVVVVSIAGDFHSGHIHIIIICIQLNRPFRALIGKSFMLNIFLRYLQSGCGTTDDWLGSTDTPLKGFSWRGGSERDTTGILMWSEPFVIKLADDPEMAIVLMNTQGAFDSEYTVRDSATVFALSTMISSIQEYGRLALRQTHEKPLQKLMFLIRDWNIPHEYPYGLVKGQWFLENKLIVNNSQVLDLQRIRRHIRSCFSQIGCYLMPHPGGKVATNPRFDGRVADIDGEFVDYLKTFVPLILHPMNVVVKEIGGRQVTGKQLEYFKVYIHLFD